MQTHPILTRRLLLTWLACLFASAPFSRADEAVVNLVTTDSKQPQAIVINLFKQDAPQTVASFEKLARRGFYNGLAVHRIVPDTLIQMGDPLSRKKDHANVGTGGPGFTLPAEIHRKHIRGAVAMAGLPTALNPARESNGSQFYICLRPQPQLDSEYTVFGQVTSGLEFLDSISRRGRDTNDYPLEDITIRSIQIR